MEYLVQCCTGNDDVVCCVLGSVFCIFTGTCIRWWYNDDTRYLYPPQTTSRQRGASISDLFSRVKQCHIISASSFSAWSTVARGKVHVKV